MAKAWDVLGYAEDGAIYCADCFKGDRDGSEVASVFAVDCDGSEVCDTCREPLEC